MTRIAVIKETSCHLGCWLAKIYFLLRALVQMPSLVGSHSLEGIPPSLTWALLYGLEFIIFIPQINHTPSLTCKHTESKDLALFIVIKET